MTNVGVPELTRRLDSLARGTARNPPSEAESRALAFLHAPSIAAAAALLSELRAMPSVRVHRPAILYSVLKALREAAPGTIPLAEAARRVRGRKPTIGPTFTQACSGKHSTAQGAGGRSSGSAEHREYECTAPVRSHDPRIDEAGGMQP